MADVHGIDMGRAALEQAVGEAAGRGARIEGAPVDDGDREPISGGLELAAASAHEGRGGPEQDDGCECRGHEARRLLRVRPGNEDGARGHGGLGLLPGIDEAASYKLGVEPATGPAGQLASFLATDLFASETFLLWDFYASVLEDPEGVLMPGRRDGATEVAGVARPGGGLAGLPRSRPWRSCRPGRSRPWRSGPALLLRILGGLAGACGHVLRGAAARLGRLLQHLGHLVGQGLKGPRVDLLELAGHLVAPPNSRTCSLDLWLRSTKLSTHSCAWLRWMSPASPNSRTISSARPRLTCPRTVPASRYLRMRSLLAIAQEYLEC